MPDDYEPFGPDWRVEMMKMRKKDLVGMLRKALVKVKAVEGLSENIANQSYFDREDMADFREELRIALEATDA